MKRIIALLLSLIIILALSACGTEGNTTPVSSDTAPLFPASDTDKPVKPQETEDTGEIKNIVYLADIYNIFEKISRSMSFTVEDIVIKSSKSGTIDTDLVSFPAFSSVSLSNFVLASAFDGEDVKAIKTSLTYLTSEDLTLDVTEDGYLLKFTSFSGEFVESAFRYDPEAEAVSFFEKMDGELTAFFDMVCLGGGKYALLSMTERAIVDFDGDTVTGFRYSTLLSDSANEIEYVNDYDTASVYGKNAVDESWLTELSAENKIEKVWAMTQPNKLVISTLLDGKYDENGNYVYVPCDPAEETVLEY